MQYEFLVISDFAENYSFLIQDEVQSYHWANQQCTIHPFCIYYKDQNGLLKNLSFLIIAESLEHNHISVYLFQQKLLDFLKTKFQQINKIYFFSDGAASQYKNKKFFYNICKMKIENNFEVEWHFFATCHGKGPCDAIGGTFKRMASRVSLQRVYTNQIQTAKELFDWAKSTDSAINVHLCTQKEHDQTARKLKYNNVKTIAGTQSFHCFIPLDNKSLKLKRYSFSEQSVNVNLVD